MTFGRSRKWHKEVHQIYLLILIGLAPSSLLAQSDEFPDGDTLTGTVRSTHSSATRLNTSVDTRSENWEYVRIYDGSSAKGQVAHITSRKKNFVTIDTVWQTGAKIVPSLPPGDKTLYDILADDMTSLPPTVGWPVASPPQAGDKIVFVKDTLFWEAAALIPGGSVNRFPAFIPVSEVLADADLVSLNIVTIQGLIDGVRATLDSQAIPPATGGPPVPLSFVDVPVIYFGRPATASTIVPRTAGAFTPGLANAQILAGTLYFPRQFVGPRSGTPMRDIFEAFTAGLLPGAEFVQDWNTYHRFDGEVHCGTAAKRKIPLTDWWETMP